MKQSLFPFIKKQQLLLYRAQTELFTRFDVFMKISLPLLTRKKKYTPPTKYEFSVKLENCLKWKHIQLLYFIFNDKNMIL